MLIRTLLAMSLLMLSVTVKAQQTLTWMGGNQLKSMMVGADWERSTATGYVLGVADSHKVRFVSGACFEIPAEGVTRSQLVAVVKKWLDDHPAALHYSADSLVVASLAEAFPCPKK